ncbi:TIGR03564 family F420-dependent LLM class oxidoreductase [Amycolatopsis sp. NBC_01307]|uniref:TIGR03564 family F420-dependent LLM class oxidoreductase n=1 Tax=Amycolatopsis sp. NBC_01307 TaxID=2903561 RepID=UPI002E0E8241|nr:TIGR03564 family F420-dependent LLM class oxidoreductase [Amycolatopsis sp. NBC_01307]
MMRIGLYVPSADVTLDDIGAQVGAAETAGLDSVFFPQLTAWDALTVAALVGQRVPRIGLGTAVVRTYAVHPLALAGQALSVQAAIGNRLTLGIGPSHREIIEGQYGLSFDRPARHVREYLQVLRPLLRGEEVERRGEAVSAAGIIDVPGSTPPSVLVSALGPVMLRIAGELADGTTTVWAGPEVIGDHIVPAVTRAAAAAGRPAPRVVATIPVSVTADPDGVRADLAARLGAASRFASYRRLLGEQGKTDTSETLVAGDEDAVAAAIHRFAEAGVTELVASVAGGEADRARTVETLRHLRKTLPQNDVS